MSDADLIVTATFASKPVLQAEWVKAGAHIMAVGAAVPDMAEMDPELLRSAEVITLNSLPDQTYYFLKTHGNVL